jgi:hypothetical protein
LRTQKKKREKENRKKKNKRPNQTKRIEMINKIKG